MNTAGNTASYEPEYETDSALPAWKLELNAKLAAHRQRRPAPASDPNDQAEPGERMQRRSDGSARAASVAARVAERYAKAPSYSEFLAASAAAAAAAAETAAFAARQADEAAEVFARLSAAQPADDCDPPGSSRAASSGVASSGAAAHSEVGSGVGSCPAAPWGAIGLARAAAAGSEERQNTVEHPEPLPPRGIIPPRPASPSSSAAGIVDAFAEATVSPAVSLPAKLIEFPRELIAARKSRPRIAEGPLFEEAEAAPLRIFEVGDAEGVRAADGDAGRQGAALRPEVRDVDPDLHRQLDQVLDRQSEEEAWGGAAAYREELSSVSQARPAYAGADLARLAYDLPREAEQKATDWQSIRLGEHPAADAGTYEPQASSRNDVRRQEQKQQAAPVLHPASLADRAMAALVDGIVVGAAFLLFVLVFAACTTHLPVNKAALVCCTAALAALVLLYQWLFLSYGGSTPGMRYAQIALCTFADDNPPRMLRQRRVAASVLSALPLGLGFLWALFDEDGLGWHDRLSGSYQRSCR